MTDLTMNPVGLILLIGFIAAAIYDLALVIFKGTSGTISQFLIGTAYKSPIISATFGMLFGHLFFQMYPDNCAFNWSARLVTALCGAGLGIGVYVLIQAWCNSLKNRNTIRLE